MVSEPRKLRQLEEENARLKSLVANLDLGKHILQQTIRNNRRSNNEAGEATGTHAVDPRDFSHFSSARSSSQRDR